jgi:hypothetical protein
MSETKYAYSLNEEDFHGEFDSREAAVAEAKEECEHDGYGQSAVWTGRIVKGADLLRAGYRPHSLGESAIARADEILENDISADDYIITATDEQKEELGRIIVEWICTHCEFHRWGVQDVQAHDIDVMDEQEPPR